MPLVIRWPSKDDWREVEKRFHGPSRVLSTLGGAYFAIKGIFWLLDWKSQIEEAVNTGEQLGPIFHALFSVITSAWFGIFLVAAGLLYALFVPREEHPRPSVKIANIAAWTACFLSAMAVFTFATYGFALRLLAVTELQPSGFMQISEIEIPQIFSTIDVGKRFGFNFHSLNPTPTRLFDVYGYSNAYVLKTSDDSDRNARETFNRELRPIKQRYMSGDVKGADEGEGPGIWTTVLTPALTQQQIEDFQTGAARFYFLSWLTWRDANGRIGNLYDCRWLQPISKTYYQKEDVVWHYCQ